MAVNSMPLTIGEILQKVKVAGSKLDRIKILKDNDSKQLRDFLRLAFDPSVKLDISENVLYTPNPKPIGFGDTTLKTQLTKTNSRPGGFYMFFHKNTPRLRQAKREILFIQLLEGLDKQEAAFLVEAKNKKLDVGLTRKVIDEVFPGLLSGASSKTEKSHEEEITAESNS